MDEYASHDRMSLAQLVREGDVSPAELTEAAITRIVRHISKLNAVVFKAFDDARQRAAGKLPDGPFRGMPLLIKDLAMPVAGWPRTSGSKYTRDYTDARDGGLTARYCASGVVFLCKMNRPEYGITCTTESAALGRAAMRGARTTFAAVHPAGRLPLSSASC